MNRPPSAFSGAGGNRIASLLRATLVAGAAGFAWSLLEAQAFTRRWATVPASVPGTPALRILHLSDLHLAPGQRRKQRFVRSLLASGPDMIVVTGDILGHPQVIDEAVDFLGPLGESAPCFFSLGSNDFFAPVAKNPLHYFSRVRSPISDERLDTPRLVAGLERHGWRCVDNQRFTHATPAGTVDVLGLGDAHIDRDRPQDWPEAVASEDVAAEPVLRLGIAHAPYLRVLDVFARHAVDVVLAGHTHGGQVRIPGVGALVDNCDLPLHQARGLSVHSVLSPRPAGSFSPPPAGSLSRPPAGSLSRPPAGSMWLHVSAGLGTNRYTPIRFACRPEATVVDVVARPDGAD